jgi:hypothetical protein
MSSGSSEWLENDDDGQYEPTRPEDSQMEPTRPQSGSIKVQQQRSPSESHAENKDLTARGLNKHARLSPENTGAGLYGEDQSDDDDDMCLHQACLSGDISGVNMILQNKSSLIHARDSRVTMCICLGLGLGLCVCLFVCVCVCVYARMIAG